MFSGGPTQRIEPGSSNKRIRSRLRATYPYSLDLLVETSRFCTGFLEIYFEVIGIDELAKRSD